VLRYIKNGRPRSASEHVFVRHHAPTGPLQSASAVYHRVVQATEAAGVVLSRPGSHVLRHTAATQMLRKGASLDQIQAVLRHRHRETTSIYAKVDVTLLSGVVQPWPRVRQ
jgi:integrase/recombinase XerD